VLDENTFESSTAFFKATQLKEMNPIFRALLKLFFITLIVK